MRSASRSFAGQLLDFFQPFVGKIRQQGGVTGGWRLKKPGRFLRSPASRDTAHRPEEPGRMRTSRPNPMRTQQGRQPRRSAPQAGAKPGAPAPQSGNPAKWIRRRALLSGATDGLRTPSTNSGVRPRVGSSARTRTAVSSNGWSSDGAPNRTGAESAGAAFPSSDLLKGAVQYFSRSVFVADHACSCNLPRKRRERPVQQDAGRAFRQVHPIRHHGGRHRHDDPEDDHLPVIERDFIHRPPQILQLLVPDHVFVEGTERSRAQVQGPGNPTSGFCWR